MSSGSPVSATRPVMPAPDDDGEQLRRCSRVGSRQVAAEGERHQVVAVANEHAAVVVVDEEPELVRDREPDLRDVVEPRELPREALQHLQVRDRANVVAAGRRSDGRSVDVSSNGTTSPFPRVLAVIIAASAQATSSRGFAACVGPTATPVETVSRPDGLRFELAELLAQPLRERSGVRDVARTAG